MCFVPIMVFSLEMFSFNFPLCNQYFVSNLFVVLIFIFCGIFTYIICLVYNFQSIYCWVILNINVFLLFV